MSERDAIARRVEGLLMLAVSVGAALAVGWFVYAAVSELFGRVARVADAMARAGGVL